MSSGQTVEKAGNTAVGAAGAVATEADTGNIEGFGSYDVLWLMG
jgi:hypothetical protein